MFEIKRKLIQPKTYERKGLMNLLYCESAVVELIAKCKANPNIIKLLLLLSDEIGNIPLKPKKLIERMNYLKPIEVYRPVIIKEALVNCDQSVMRVDYENISLQLNKLNLFEERIIVSNCDDLLNVFYCFVEDIHQLYHSIYASINTNANDSTEYFDRKLLFLQRALGEVSKQIERSTPLLVATYVCKNDVDSSNKKTDTMDKREPELIGSIMDTKNDTMLNSIGKKFDQMLDLDKKMAKLEWKEKRLVNSDDANILLFKNENLFDEYKTHHLCFSLIDTILSNISYQQNLSDELVDAPVALAGEIGPEENLYAPLVENTLLVSEINATVADIKVPISSEQPLIAEPPRPQTDRKLLKLYYKKSKLENEIVQTKGKETNFICNSILNEIISNVKGSVKKLCRENRITVVDTFESFKVDILLSNIYTMKANSKITQRQFKYYQNKIIDRLKTIENALYNNRKLDYFYSKQINSIYSKIYSILSKYCQYHTNSTNQPSAYFLGIYKRNIILHLHLIVHKYFRILFANLSVHYANLLHKLEFGYETYSSLVELKTSASTENYIYLQLQSTLEAIFRETADLTANDDLYFSLLDTFNLKEFNKFISEKKEQLLL